MFVQLRALPRSAWLMGRHTTARMARRSQVYRPGVRPQRVAEGVAAQGLSAALGLQACRPAGLKFLCHRLDAGSTRRDPRRRVVAAQRARIARQGKLFKPALKGRAVNADEVTTVAANRREAGLVGLLVQDLFAHLAQLGRLGPCEQQWRVNLPVGPGELWVFCSH
jgi:hypothetical protein